MMADDPPDLDEQRRRAARAIRVAEELAELGGVVGLPDLPGRWGISYDTARDHTRRDGFPQPWQQVGDSYIWIAAEVDLWRAEPRRRGRPSKRETE